MFADANHHRGSNVRWTHRIYPDRMWEANLYHFYNRLIQVLPRPIMIKDGIRQEETSAHVLIREALINCNKDLTGASALSTERNSPQLNLSYILRVLFQINYRRDGKTKNKYTRKTLCDILRYGFDPVAQDLTRITPCCLIREKRRHHWGRLLCRIPIYTDWTRRTEE